MPTENMYSLYTLQVVTLGQLIRFQKMSATIKAPLLQLLFFLSLFERERGRGERAHAHAHVG